MRRLVDVDVLLNIMKERKTNIRSMEKADEDEQIVKMLELFAERAVFTIEPLESGGGMIESNIYNTEELHENCTVQVLFNSMTGERSIGWWQND